MHWTDDAIVITIKKHGETSGLVRLFTKSHGVYSGIVRGAHSKARRGVLQPGNTVSATWQARLPEHMGTFTCELLQATMALIMQDAVRLSALDSACAVLAASLPERHPYPRLYKALAQWLEGLRIQDSGSGDTDWIKNYVRLELLLLAEAGFGLDLSCCAATGTTEDLLYVSPKSGRAVSREAGEPYREKLLVLPKFLLVNSQQEKFRESPLPHGGGGLGRGHIDRQEILAGLRLTGYFLDSWLFAPHNRKLPAARERMMKTLKISYNEIDKTTAKG